MNKKNIDQHISQQFNSDLEALRTELMEMGGLVEQQVADAATAIETADKELAEKVISTESSVDTHEVNIDEHCTEVLARRQPAASDLRFVLAVSKATRDLERVGDEAKKVALMALALCESGQAPRGYLELRHIASSVQAMLHDSLDAFARYDVEKALQVAAEDKNVDREYASALREMMTYMMEDPRSISRVMNIMWSLRALERIGDHARNIAEHVIYVVKGKDVRHVSINDLAREVNG
jgi:phosphate transport system protein